MEQRAVIPSMAALLVFCFPAYAQPDAHNQIQQIEQQRQREFQKSLEQLQRERGRVLTPDSREYSVDEAEGRCFDVNEVRVQGVSVFSRKDIVSVVSRYQGRCLGVSQLDSLLNAISALYFNRGYVTSRAYLSEQNLSSGTVVVQVVEGVLQSIGVDGTDDEGESQALQRVFPARVDEALNLRDIEQGLEAINRLQSYRATVNLLPGSELGQTRVEVAYQLAEPWQLQLNANNSGQESTGERQLQGLLSWDNPLGFYDFGYISYQVDAELSRDKRSSESLALHWDVPLGYWSIGVDLTHFRYGRPIRGNGLEFSASGDANTQTLSASRVLFRDRDTKARMKWALARKQTRNFVEDVRLDVSSRVLGLSTLALEYEQYFRSGAFLLSEFTYTRGLDAFGSPVDGALDASIRSSAPKAQFDRYNLRLDYRHPFQWLGESLQYKTLWEAQHSPDVLFGSEQISIGSLYTVRGYKASGLSGDSGSYWRNDLSWILRPQSGDRLIDAIVPYVGFDVGRVRNAHHHDKYRSLKGWVLGVSMQGKGWTGELSFASPLNAPGDLNSTREEVSVSLSMTL